MHTAVNRRRLLVGTAAVAGIAATGVTAGTAVAATAKSGQQVPGLHRLNVGEIEVTAVLDGHIDLPTNAFPKADAAGIERLQKDSFVAVGDQVRAPVNSYVVNTGDRLVLIDSGCGGLFGPDLGKVATNLKAAGVEPAAIDTILVTHLHPDHIGGTFSKEGASLFPKAEMVVNEADIAFWTNNDIAAKAPADIKDFWAWAQSSLKAYDGRVRRFSKDGEAVKSITAVQLPGHTPGHSGYMITSGNQSLLVWGDIIHSAALQFAKPDWSIAFDVDMDMGAATRRKVFDMAATDRLLVAGMHVPFPGVGHVVKATEGYAFVPQEWRYTL